MLSDSIIAVVAILAFIIVAIVIDIYGDWNKLL